MTIEVVIHKNTAVPINFKLENQIIKIMKSKNMGFKWISQDYTYNDKVILGFEQYSFLSHALQQAARLWRWRAQ